MSKVKTSAKMAAVGHSKAGGGSEVDVAFQNKWTFQCHDKNGNLKWEVEEFNLVTNEGLNDILDKYFKGSAYTASFFVGLTDGTPTIAAADVMNSHAGWAEVTAYDEATRPALTLGSVSAQAVNNSASKASYTVSADTTVIGGAFLTTVNTKGGTTGILVAAVAFTAGNKSLDDDDVLTVQVNLSAASA